jgi:D-alanine-D-alanine ligase
MKNLALFYGGYSSEFDISRLSAENIRTALPDHYNVLMIEVTKNAWKVKIEEVYYAFDMNSLSATIEGESTKIDVGLVFIHGDPGENGKIQAFLEMKGIPCVNTGALASELSFDKWYCNQFLRAFDVPVAKSVRIVRGEKVDSEEIISKLGLPVFVKPTDAGSSFGITKVKKTEDLESAVKHAFTEGGTVIIESFLDGNEVTCAVYGRKEGLLALPMTEIVSEGEFFDYDAKYLGKSQEITPARISEDLTLEIQGMTKRIYKLLGLSSISRVDYMLVKNRPFVIEVNTTPGFTSESLVPQMLACAGISQKQFWAEIMEYELELKAQPLS